MNKKQIIPSHININNLHENQKEVVDCFKQYYFNHPNPYETLAKTIGASSAMTVWNLVWDKTTKPHYSTVLNIYRFLREVENRQSKQPLLKRIFKRK